MTTAPKNDSNKEFDEISSSQGGDYEDDRLLGCGTA
jgi:hypothetical protein